MKRYIFLLLFLILATSIHAVEYQSKSELISDRLTHLGEITLFVGDELSIDLDSRKVLSYDQNEADIKMTTGQPRYNANVYGKYGVSYDCSFDKSIFVITNVNEFCVLTDKEHVFIVTGAFCGDTQIVGSKYQSCLYTINDLGNRKDGTSQYSKDLSTYLTELKQVEGLSTLSLDVLKDKGVDFDSDLVVTKENADVDMTLTTTYNFATKYGFAEDCNNLDQIKYYLASPPDKICVLTSANNVIELTRIINPFMRKIVYNNYKYAWKNLGPRERVSTGNTSNVPEAISPSSSDISVKSNELQKSIFKFWYLFLLVVVIILILIIWEKVIRPRKTKEVRVGKPENAKKQIETQKPSYGSYEQAISVSGFTLKAKSTTILEDVSFKIKKGDMVCLLGPSGTGKSTVIESLVGRKTPTRGSLHILEQDIHKNKNVYDHIAFVPQHAELYMNQTVKQNVLNSATKWGVKDAEKRIDEVLSKVGLKDRKDVKAAQLSGGQQKLLSLGMELIRDIEVCILDEPTTGLDPNTRNNIITILSHISRQMKKTVFFTTHFMDDAEECDEVIIFANKKIVSQGPPTKLERMLPGGGKVVNVILDNVTEDLFKKVEKIEGVKKVIREGRNLRILTDTPNAVKMGQKIDEIGGTVNETKIDNASMMDVFVYNTGEKPDET